MCGAGAAIIIAVVIEVFSPSRRSREKLQRDMLRAENSVNIVLAVASGILCAAALGLTLCGERDMGAILLVAPVSAALRQTFWFMRACGAVQQENQSESQRKRLLKRISCGKFRL